MAKILGYLLSLAGLCGVVAYTFPEVATYAAIPSSLIGLPWVIVSVAVTIAGVFLIGKSGGGRQAQEVPIYKGKNIVGYRRMK